jgi:multisubunit Na+/H+ antiporter MnhB subunit
MEKDSENILLKNRSSRACIRDGYHFYFSNFKRIFKATWLIAIVFAVLSAAASAIPVLLSPELALAGSLLTTVAVILLLIVAWRILRKRQLLEATAHIPFKNWLRHTGMILIVGIVCLFTVSILIMLTSLPMVIMMAANWQNQIGVLSGDPSGMPDYVRWLTLAVFLIAGFLQAYVWQSVIGPIYMIRGAMIQHENERQKFNKIEKETTYETNLIYRP